MKGNDENAAKARDPDDDAPAAGAKPDKTPAAPDRGDGKAVEYAPRPAGRGGFFTIHKNGQGYWTRMGTLVGVGVLGLMLSYTLYDKIPPFFNDPTFGRRVGLGIAVGFLAAFAVVALYLMNKPANVDFLIATDSEMKKVNWTSRKELTGSTKIVVIFMFLIATFLFLADQIFHLLFWGIGVLKTKPFFIP